MHKVTLENDSTSCSVRRHNSKAKPCVDWLEPLTKLYVTCPQALDPTPSNKLNTTANYFKT